MPGTAAIITVGSELVEGLRVDTNTAEIARSLGPRGFTVTECVSVGDDIALLADLIGRLTASVSLVVVTGGLGPTHDDITREAASRALDAPLERDPRLVALLQPAVSRHLDAEAAQQVLTQADVLAGAEVMDPTTGTAPGLIAPTPAGHLVLLPGPPSEMRPMLARFLGRFPLVRAEAAELGVVGLGESDAQVRTQRALAAHPGIALTVLARPGDVRVLLLDDGAGAEGLAAAAHSVAEALGPSCYTTTGETLEQALVQAAMTAGVSLATAESCTGGLVGGAITEVAGSSAVYRGGVVSYSNEAKASLLGVPEGLLAEYGAVSEPVARAMAEGARVRLGADVAVSVTGIAGPDGGTADKPVGLVWFAVASRSGTEVHEKRFQGGSRSSVRMRAVATALDLLRLEVLRP